MRGRPWVYEFPVQFGQNWYMTITCRYKTNVFDNVIIFFGGKREIGFNSKIIYEFNFYMNFHFKYKNIMNKISIKYLKLSTWLVTTNLSLCNTIHEKVHRYCGFFS